MKYVDETYSIGDFKLVYNNKAADIYVSSEDFKGVIRAVKTLREDINKVSRILPKLRTSEQLSENTVIIGTIGNSPIIDRLIAEGKLDAADVKEKWEAFVIQTVDNPMTDVDKALVIAGSNKRGTIFGVYDLSEQIGISPWHWWADIPARHRDDLIVRQGIYKQGEPSVKYRGIFFNDEGPSLMAWVRANYRDFTHEFYEHVFELILRLKGNYLWPAMWDNAFNEDDELNPLLADEYGIVMGTSHHEPMIRAHGEWKKHRKGPWDYSVNEEYLYRFWEHGIERNKNFESIVTLGMRGDGDEEMGGQLTFKKKIELLQKIVQDQRKIIREKMNSDVTKVPQLWALYKEVQDYYENGMRVPEDITLLWSDDNHGNLRRVPTEEERGRSGGAGIYYHLDYVGGPRSYKWINTVPLQKIWEQMHKAYEYGADRIWILNVGDLKPMEFQTEYFFRMAWNMDEFNKDNTWKYSVRWAEREFGKEYAEDISYIINRYSKLNGRLKPELLNAVELYSQTNYKEADSVIADFNEITVKAENIYEKLPDNLKDAFFQVAFYPAKASAQVTELYLTAEKNKLYAAQGRASTNELADMAEKIFEADAELTFDYNKRMAFGRWNHMMDQTHIGYTYWNYPPENIMPEVTRLKLESGAEMGVAIEGSAEAWPISSKRCILPKFDGFNRESRYIDIFNRKKDIFAFSIDADEKWIKLSSTKGTIELEKRIWIDIDWDNAPKGEDVQGSIRVSSSSGQTVAINLSLFNPVEIDRTTLEGFIESNGYISIEAEHYTKKVDTNNAGWEKIPDYGRTLSSMTVFPVKVPSTTPPENSPCLEYKVYIVNPGELEVTTLIAPTIDFIPGQGLRLGISFDDQPIKIADFSNCDWDESVIYNIRKAKTAHNVEGYGYHTLKIWMVDPIVVLQKILINMGGLKPSYLGAPESYYGGKKETGKKYGKPEELKLMAKEKALMIVRPTLRLNDVLPEKPLTAQIEVSNRDIFSHKFALTISLFDERGNIIDSVSNMGIIARKDRQMYNYCFKEVENSKRYKLKTSIIYEKNLSEYEFELEQPDQSIV
ncbi:glycosyl hydrolase 115 family protein [Clostridium oryzae]|uniref:Gylcosyl hydrolase 115 C-terminal domain-containing protein n=1 Tax=Clostridium oryzae TaxID=1450648 RepID=A0A1V4IJI2_9CLOT|nr:glycosyl hydrolase 115 family protein [Clostridium oryzae]OPJ59885.1 hypothetical protein CLORY_31020 [Clostridium oryzae]